MSHQQGWRVILKEHNSMMDLEGPEGDGNVHVEVDG